MAIETKLMQLLGHHGIHSKWDLLAIAEKTDPPEEQPADSEDWCADVPFNVNGWVVRFFYDCGELDYITDFVTPNGETIDFWDWSEDHPWKNTLMAWRSVGDLARLKAL